MNQKKTHGRTMIAADFESTQKGEFSLWGLIHKDLFYWGINLQSFFDTIKKFKISPMVYFHNLSRFDGIFIIKNMNKVCMHNHTYKPVKHICKFYRQQKQYTEKKVLFYYRKTKVRKYVEKPETQEADLQQGEWKMFMDDSNVYEIRVASNRTKRRTKKGKIRQRVISFRCSKKLFSGTSIKSMAQILNIPRKLDYDYKKIQVYKTKEETPKILTKYLERDCRILDTFLREQDKILPKNQWKLTAAATAYSQFINKGLEQWSKMLNIKVKQYVNKFGYKSWIYKGKKWKGTSNLARNLFNQICPVKWLDELNEDGITHYTIIKETYKGGMTYARRDIQGKALKNVAIYDIISMYPDIMKNYSMPCGKPFYGDGGKNYPLKIYEITADSFETEGLPIISLKMNNLNDTEVKTYYFNKYDKSVILRVWDITRDYLKKHYKMKNYREKIIYSFKKIEGKNIFGQHVDYYFEKKNNTCGAEKLIHKIMLNSVYGKFGTRNLKENKLFNEETNLFEIEKKRVKASYYIPIASRITAQSRLKLAYAVPKKAYRYFYYCDTDSVHIDSNHKNLFKLNIGSKLGQWSLETDHAQAMYRRTKQYMVITEKGHVNIKLATAGGADISIFTNSTNVEAFEKFKNEFILKKLKREIVETGVVLELNKIVFKKYNHPDYPDWNPKIIELYPTIETVFPKK